MIRFILFFSQALVSLLGILKASVAYSGNRLAVMGLGARGNLYHKAAMLMTSSEEPQFLESVPMAL